MFWQYDETLWILVLHCCAASTLASSLPFIINKYVKCS